MQPAHPFLAVVGAGNPLVISGHRVLDAAVLRAAGHPVVQIGDGRPSPGISAVVLTTSDP